MEPDTLSAFRRGLAKIKARRMRAAGETTPRHHERRIETGLPPVVLGKPEGWVPSFELVRECPTLAALLPRNKEIPKFDETPAPAPRKRKMPASNRHKGLQKNSVFLNPLYAELREALANGETARGFAKRKGVGQSTIATAVKKLGLKSRVIYRTDTKRRISEVIAHTGVVDCRMIARIIGLKPTGVRFHLTEMYKQ